MSEDARLYEELGQIKGTLEKLPEIIAAEMEPRIDKMEANLKNQQNLCQQAHDKELEEMKARLNAHNSEIDANVRTGRTLSWILLFVALSAMGGGLIGGRSDVIVKFLVGLLT